MRNLSMGTATAGLLIALLSGCASSPVVMRGQSPEAYVQAPQGGDIQLMEYNYQESLRAKQRVRQQIAHRFAGEADHSSQQQSYQVNNQPIQQQFQQQPYQQTYQQSYQPNDQQYCPPMVDGNGRCIPSQHYKFRYVVPQGLNYPPQDAMPGVIQYPYYTVKGPDCFFHQ